jgi:hypothetical protein
MPKAGELRYITDKAYAQGFLDKANDAFLKLGVGVTGEHTATNDDLFNALMAAWDYISETTKQEIYK